MAAAAGGPSRPPCVHELLVLYGSQTGTAQVRESGEKEEQGKRGNAFEFDVGDDSQEVAERVAREGRRRGFASRLSAMDDYPLADLPGEKRVVFVVATTGDGEAPDNMRRTWTFLLQRALPATALEGMEVAVLGLGDSRCVRWWWKMKRRREEKGEEIRRREK